MGKSKGQMKSRLSYSAGAFGNDVFYATLSTYFIMFVKTQKKQSKIVTTYY